MAEELEPLDVFRGRLVKILIDVCETRDIDAEATANVYADKIIAALPKCPVCGDGLLDYASLCSSCASDVALESGPR